MNHSEAHLSSTSSEAQAAAAVSQPSESILDEQTERVSTESTERTSATSTHEEEMSTTGCDAPILQPASEESTENVPDHDGSVESADDEETGERGAPPGRELRSNSFVAFSEELNMTGTRSDSAKQDSLSSKLVYTGTSGSRHGATSTGVEGDQIANVQGGNPVKKSEKLLEAFRENEIKTEKEKNGFLRQTYRKGSARDADCIYSRLRFFEEKAPKYSPKHYTHPMLWFTTRQIKSDDDAYRTFTIQMQPKTGKLEFQTSISGRGDPNVFEWVWERVKGGEKKYFVTVPEGSDCYEIIFLSHWKPESELAARLPEDPELLRNLQAGGTGTNTYQLGVNDPTEKPDIYNLEIDLESYGDEHRLEICYHYVERQLRVFEKFHGVDGSREMHGVLIKGTTDAGTTIKTREGKETTRTLPSGEIERETENSPEVLISIKVKHKAFSGLQSRSRSKA